MHKNIRKIVPLVFSVTLLSGLPLSSDAMWRSDSYSSADSCTSGSGRSCHSNDGGGSWSSGWSRSDSGSGSGYQSTAYDRSDRSGGSDRSSSSGSVSSSSTTSKSSSSSSATSAPAKPPLVKPALAKVPDMARLAIVDEVKKAKIGAIGNLVDADKLRSKMGQVIDYYTYIIDLYTQNPKQVGNNTKTTSACRKTMERAKAFELQRKAQLEQKIATLKAAVALKPAVPTPVKAPVAVAPKPVVVAAPAKPIASPPAPVKTPAAILIEASKPKPASITPIKISDLPAAPAPAKATPVVLPVQQCDINACRQEIIKQCVGVRPEIIDPILASYLPSVIENKMLPPQGNPLSLGLVKNVVVNDVVQCVKAKQAEYERKCGVKP